MTEAKRWREGCGESKWRRPRRKAEKDGEQTRRESRERWAAPGACGKAEKRNSADLEAKLCPEKAGQVGVALVDEVTHTFGQRELLLLARDCDGGAWFGSEPAAQSERC